MAVTAHTDALDRIVRASLAEDVGSGDVTTDATVDEAATGTAVLVTRAPGVVAGLDAVEAVFRALDPDVEVERLAEDGDVLHGPAPVARVSGSLRAILTGERTALNLLGRLSGIATRRGATSTRSRAREWRSSTRARRRPDCVRSRSRRSPPEEGATTASGSTTACS